MVTRTHTTVEILDRIMWEEFDRYYNTLPSSYPMPRFTGPPAKLAWYCRLRFFLQRLLKWR